MSAEPASLDEAVLVLLCGDLAKEGLDPFALASGVDALEPGTRTEVVDGLCSEPSLVESRLARVRPASVVVGFCGVRSVAPVIDAAARRAGMSPLAVQALPLGAICAQGPSRMERARILLAAAAARARAFPGSRPEHLKPSLRSRRGPATRRSLFSLPSLSYRPVPAIDAAACMASTGCDRCVAVCPVEALRWTGGEIELQRDVCTSCGACVAECPWRAMEMPGWSPPEIEAQLSSLLASGDGSAIAYVCADTPVPAGDWFPVPVRCVGGLPVAALIEPIVRGAAAVGVVACGCRTSRRPDVLRRIDYCRALLAALGLPVEHVQLLQMDGDYRLSPPAALRPLPSARNDGPLRLSGAGTDASAICRLATMAGRPNLQLRHAASPIGMVAIDRDACTGCGTCATACPTAALALAEGDQSVAIEFTPARCVACDLCVDACPEQSRGAIAMERVTDAGAIAGGARILAQEDVARCRACGGPVAPAGVLSRVADILGTQFDARRMAELCPSCR